MKPGVVATNLVWLVHQASAALADPKGHIERRDGDFGPMFRPRDGNDAEEDGPDAAAPGRPDEAGAIRRVMASLLSDVYKANVTAAVEKTEPLPGADPKMRAKVCLPDACFVSEYASRHTELQAEVAAWALLAYQVNPSFAPLLAWTSTQLST